MQRCPICEKNHLKTRADAKLVVCPECERKVCEDCMTEMHVVTPSIIPDTDPWNAKGTVMLCLECAGV